MDIEVIQQFCLNLTATTEDLKWDHNLCYCVKDKIFCIISLDETPPTIGVKLSPEDFEEWITRDGVTQSPYLARGNWIKITDTNQISPVEIQELIINSYQIIRGKLTKKVQAELQALEKN